jgi:hypothetical protein
MPQIVVAAAITASVSAVATAGIAAFGTAAFYTAFQTAFTTNLVLGSLSYALAKKGSGGTLSSMGQTVTARQSVASHNVIYGRTRVGGVIVHMEATDNNKYLHMVLAIAGHEIDAVEEIYFNEELVTLDGSNFGYDGKARIEFKYGTDDQTAFSNLVSESDAGWTNNHRLRGIACAYVRLEFDQDKFPQGMPNISFVVRGKKVYDPRTSTTYWSANSALCLNDYLTNTKYGVGVVYANEIDSTTLIASANICDEDVDLDAGGTENRYECHGVISTSSNPSGIINAMLSSMAGKAIFSGGKWRILAGAYYTPTLTFDEDDMAGGMRVQSLVSRRENFNCIKGVFSSATQNYVNTDFPPIISSTFIAQDNGETVYKNIQLPFTTSASMAQRLAKIELLKARQQITLNLPLKLHGLQANVGDVIQVTNTRMGWSSKPFEVVSMQMALGESLGVDLSLREISADVFDWSTSEEQAFDPAPNTNLPNAFSVGAISNITVNLSSYFYNNYGLIEWQADDAFISSYKVVISGDPYKDYLPVNINMSSRSVSIYKNRVYKSGQRKYSEYKFVTTMTQGEFDLIKIGHYIEFSNFSQTKLLISQLEFDGSTASIYASIATLFSGAETNVSTFISTANHVINVWWQLSNDYPSKYYYQEYITTDKKLGALNLIAGNYSIAITPRNIFDVVGETSTIFFPIPEPPLLDKVSGLEIDLGADGEAHSLVWTGKDCKIKWRPASLTFSFDVNDYEAYGIDSGSPDDYLKDYKIAVYNSSDELLREEFVTTTAYVYTYEKNSEDAAKYGDAPYRDLTFKIWARGKQNQLSEQAATL